KKKDKHCKIMYTTENLFIIRAKKDYFNNLSAASISVSLFLLTSWGSRLTAISTGTPFSRCSPFKLTVWVTESRYCHPLGSSPEEGAPPPPPVLSPNNCTLG